MQEILVNSEAILEVTPEVVSDLKRRAMASPRRRSRLLMHHVPEHLTQEMLIVFHQGSYMPPHRHPAGKSESYHLLAGTMTVFFFDDAGRVLRTIDLGPAGGERASLYRLSAPLWHMPVATSEWLVYHEVYTGPFVKERDVEFAPWAPPEGAGEAAERYVAGLLARSVIL